MRSSELAAYILMAQNITAILREGASGEPDPSVQAEAGARLDRAIADVFGDGAQAFRAGLSFRDLAKKILDLLQAEHNRIQVLGRALTEEELLFGQVFGEAQAEVRRAYAEPGFSSAELLELRRSSEVSCSLSPNGRLASLVWTTLGCESQADGPLFDKCYASFCLPVTVGAEESLRAYSIDLRAGVNLRGRAQASILVEIDGVPFARDLAFGDNELHQELRWTLLVPVGRRPKSESGVGFFDVTALRGTVFISVARRTAEDGALVSVDSLDIEILR